MPPVVVVVVVVPELRVPRVVVELDLEREVEPHAVSAFRAPVAYPIPRCGHDPFAFQQSGVQGRGASARLFLVLVRGWHMPHCA